MIEFLRVFSILAPFWEALEAQALPKNQEKSTKTLQKSILGCVLGTSVFEGGFWEGFGMVLGGFWHDFGRILGRFWKDFGKIFGTYWGDKL